MGGVKVALIGSGNWGSAIARIIGGTVKKFSNEFDQTVSMYVHEEMVNGRKLTEIINTDHENIKYLPDFKLPTNIVAEPDLLKSSQDADILIFVVPHQFISNICKSLSGKIKKTAAGVTLIKGVGESADGGIRLISNEIKELLNIPVSALMGANIATEVAAEKFCEATLGCKDQTQSARLKRLFQTENFRIQTTQDVHTVELCGALKNIVACAVGFVDGLEYGDNTKAAVMRLGLLEMRQFIDHFYPDSTLDTYFESCGIADLIATCSGGRNHKVSQAFVKTGKTIRELEKEMLNGQILQGPATASQVNKMLKEKNLEDKFPVFTSVHYIATNEWKPEDLIGKLRQTDE